ncbi:CAP domain-containing protein [Cyclobacterium xiamenense]|uniref:CAP domain-containing protein n=1 Tax=Cyclobacterium xiamenense TaxID=1297121 RepID=UPI0012B984FB|nr:CAP domain-containing protein [Cyclobacterium xiamenense]
MTGYLILFWWLSFGGLAPGNPIRMQDSPEEKELFDAINGYRESRGLPAVPFSAALSKVAKAHARDLMVNYRPNKRCNLHSWSDQGPWEACCYRDDHKNPECMWNKPLEIAGYTSPGYEIAYWHSAAASPGHALEMWKKSPGHHAVLANLAPFKAATWKALGVGIYKQYAVVWFGEKEDNP